MYWELALRNGDLLEKGTEGVYRMEGTKVFYKDKLSSLGKGVENGQKPQQVGY